MYKIEWCVVKSPDWKILTLLNGGGEKHEDVSVNRVNKKGEVFPDFDNIQAGREINGELWTSQTGKNYLFAPKTSGKPQYRASGGNSIAKAQEKKAEYIAVAQDKKEESIAWFNATNSAIALISAVEKEALSPVSSKQEVKDAIIYWRDWFYQQWLHHDPEDNKQPF